VLRIASVALTVVLLAAAAGATWAVVRAGHTGAEMAWSDSNS
jgi:hypothetical protein